MVDSPPPAEGRLAGKRVLVTGAGSGIGRAVAQLAAKEGAAAVCAADINLPAASETVEQLARAFAVEVDVARRESVDALTRVARREMGGIDVLVTAAGIGSRASFLETSEEEWHTVMDVNVSGPFRCGQSVGRVMAEQGRGGAIVHFSSFVARRVGSGGTVYAASKGAIATLTCAMAVGLARYGVRVNAVAPGPIETGMTAVRFADPAYREQMQRGLLVGRLGVPMDVAEAVVFLASDDAAFVNGAVMAVDGGLSASR